MKYLLRFFVPAAAILFFLPVSSCKKDGKTQSNSCKIATMYDTLVTASGSVETATIQISYNNDGKIATSKFDDGNIIIPKTFTYGDHLIVVTPTPGANTPTDSVYLNDAGLPLKIKQVYPGPGPQLVSYFNYTYNSHNELQLMVFQQIQNGVATGSSDTCIFANGDLVTKKNSYGTVTTYAYYTDKPAADADFNRFYSLLNYGAVPIQSKHLLKSAQSSNGLDNYIYTFDAEGKILTAADLQGSFSDRRTFVYDCSH